MEIKKKSAKLIEMFRLGEARQQLHMTTLFKVRAGETEKESAPASDNDSLLSVVRS